MDRISKPADTQTRPVVRKNGHVRLIVSLILSPLIVVVLSGVTIYADAVWDARTKQKLTAVISSLEAKTRDAGGQGQAPKTTNSRVADYQQKPYQGFEYYRLDYFKGLYDWHLKSPVRLAATVLGWVALGFGLLTLIMGTYIIRHIRGMAISARRSRDALLHSFTLGIRRLPWWLISFTSLSAISVLLLAVASGTTAMINMLESSAFDPTPNLIALIIFGAAFFLGIGYLTYSFFSIRGSIGVRRATRAALAPDPVEIMGKSVSESEAPLLWRLVRDVAVKIDAVVPDRILIGLNECFFVTENSVAVTGGQTFAGGRTLYLPLTYLAFMKRPEVEAVIGHELGHFMGEDSKYSIQFAPIYHRASSSLSVTRSIRKDLRGIESTLSEYFMSSFHEAVRHWSRLRELAADQVGAKMAGADAIASSLLRIAALSPRVNEALQICRQGGAEAEGGVLSQLLRLVAEKGMADPNIDLSDQQPHPFDSHPPTRQRIAAVGVDVTSQQLRDAQNTRPSTLLADLQLVKTDSQAVGESLGDENLGGEWPDPTPDVATAARPALHTAVEEQFSGVFEEERRKRIAFLSPIAARGLEPLSLVRLSGKMPYLGLPFGGIFMAAAVALILHGDPNEAGQVQAWLYPAFAGVFGLLMLGAGVVAILREFMPNSPFLVLNKDALTVRATGIVIPWTDMVDVDVFTMRIYGVKAGIQTIITLDPEKQLPGGWKHWSMYTRREREPNRLIIDAGRYKKMPLEEFAETVLAYWHGGLARKELADLRVTPEELSSAARNGSA